MDGAEARTNSSESRAKTCTRACVHTHTHTHSFQGIKLNPSGPYTRIFPAPAVGESVMHAKVDFRISMNQFLISNFFYFLFVWECSLQLFSCCI